ncbi:3,4-dihydroxy-2-butanone-4-phosphate synthase [Oleiphilus sp. HI0071]|jgi:3,4-dihydroxy 2-butanone 4-phosphate synthase/GTP cyclohydrolase II|nr:MULTISPECIES: bifunctional 3,4-dihydroxy-2-butanone-4-phosphate synthase/GTP cyclohydrolase II [unclassified Oleiphilus]KZY61750.1 3,4-dihydroxy-2-butanone-4-phosphate synthase [Oleiphilus sp. HI0065]KZY87818.1 3,4-dihydroxy-2-butanone-4-phosphate synthase [Oleiphilus sp. HI0071]KZY89265.1 3,4-dihydroxy-2-butanone-4-phosphate synthase [Oleiphilus sp. HI0073]KZZ51236.1 3,4-dihydroxy-2-butanone-4-phosphate synthase [Oleiphilus sp. HI0122]KZZ52539.1 3,4-dihydroxy-2-butanone-4-phosphate synthas
MKLNTVEELVEDIRQGKMVILMDDEDRENEGDLVIAAEQVRPEDINFMATHARGLICLTLTQERCRFLGLPLMVASNHAQFQTNFTVSIEAAEGVTTGISAADRAHTVRTAVGRNTKPEDIVQPGHIFPIAAQPGGVLSRAGHTEAGCDLARMAGFEASSVIVEIMNEDGTMARRPDLEEFAKKHDLKIGTIADMIHYRALNEQTVVRQEEHRIETEHGDFNLITYKDTLQGDLHMAFVKGSVEDVDAPVVRVQYPDILRDTIGVLKEGSQSWSVQNALARIAEEGAGVLVLLGDTYEASMEERLIEFFNAATPQSGGQGAYLTVGTGSQILRDLGVSKMRLLAPKVKFSALSGFDLEVTEFIPYNG